MGEARRKALSDDQLIEIDVTKIEFRIGPQDQENLVKREFASFDQELNPETGRVTGRWRFFSEAARAAYEAASAETRTTLMRVGAFSTVLSEIVARKFPSDPRTGLGGPARRDRRHIRVWQEALIDGEMPCSLPWGAIRWLRGLLGDEDLALPSIYSQWAEIMLEYVEQLKPLETEEIP